jgi:hypothetical protein
VKPTRASKRREREKTARKSRKLRKNCDCGWPHRFPHHGRNLLPSGPLPPRPHLEGEDRADDLQSIPGTSSLGPRRCSRRRAIRREWRPGASRPRISVATSRKLSAFHPDGIWDFGTNRPYSPINLVREYKELAPATLKVFDRWLLLKTTQRCSPCSAPSPPTISQATRSGSG